MKSLQIGPEQELLDFLDRWPIDRVKKMTLKQYVGIRDRDTFCQWVENRTPILGSIRGSNSSKFGIYKRGENSKKSKRLHSDEIYSWQKYYGTSRSAAFKEIQKEILTIIQYAKNEDFRKIDNIHLSQFFKWKIAYLYSNDRLIPIFSTRVLVKIARHYGINATEQTPISEIQQLMIDNKPAHLSVYEFKNYLFEKFGSQGAQERNKRKRKRVLFGIKKGVKRKRIEPQLRSGSRSYIAQQTHNKIQNELKSLLEKKYGRNAVMMEENNVDLKVTLPSEIHLFEVKSHSYAGWCLREALGQILVYSYKEDQEKKHKLFVVGDSLPNSDERRLIGYIKAKMRMEIDYMAIDEVKRKLMST